MATGYGSFSIIERSQEGRFAFVTVFNPFLQDLQTGTQKLEQKHATPLYYPPGSLLTPSHLEWFISTKDFCQASAEFFCIVLVGHPQHYLSVVLANVDV